MLVGGCCPAYLMQEKSTIVRRPPTSYANPSRLTIFGNNVKERKQKVRMFWKLGHARTNFLRELCPTPARVPCA